MFFYFISLIYTVITAEEPCKSVNYGIETEKLYEYRFEGQDTLLNYVNIINFDREGRTEKAISFAVGNADTFYSSFHYNGGKIISTKAYRNGKTDTVFNKASEWDINGRALNLENTAKPGNYTEFSIENCKVVSKRDYDEGRMSYSIDYKWQGNLVTEIRFEEYGPQRLLFIGRPQKTRFEYLHFDEKGNWTERLRIKESLRYLEKRQLSYY